MREYSVKMEQRHVIRLVGTLIENGGVKLGLQRMMGPIVTHPLLGSLHAHAPMKSLHSHIHKPYCGVCGVVVCFCVLVCVSECWPHWHTFMWWSDPTWVIYIYVTMPELSYMYTIQLYTHCTSTASIQHTSHGVDTVHTYIETHRLHIIIIRYESLLYKIDSMPDITLRIYAHTNTQCVRLECCLHIHKLMYDSNLIWWLPVECNIIVSLQWDVQVHNQAICSVACYPLLPAARICAIITVGRK